MKKTTARAPAATTKEQAFRSALAFLASQSDFPMHVRRIAHRALYQQDGGLPTVEEEDAAAHAAVERAFALDAAQHARCPRGCDGRAQCLADQK